MTASDTPNGLRTGPRYYRSFASYEIPFRPDEPVAFADTEGLKSFYRAYLDPTCHVVQFDKLLLVHKEKEPREVALPMSGSPGSTVYFRVIRAPTTGEANVGEAIHFQQTEDLDEFFAGQVDASGQTCHLRLFGKQLAFSDSYEYWPNGRLRKRTMTGTDQPLTILHFNEKGRSVVSPASESVAETSVPTT